MSSAVCRGVARLPPSKASIRPRAARPHRVSAFRTPIPDTSSKCVLRARLPGADIGKRSIAEDHITQEQHSAAPSRSATRPTERTDRDRPARTPDRAFEPPPAHHCVNQSGKSAQTSHIPQLVHLGVSPKCRQNLPMAAAVALHKSPQDVVSLPRPLAFPWIAHLVDEVGQQSRRLSFATAARNRPVAHRAPRVPASW